MSASAAEGESRFRVARVLSPGAIARFHASRWPLAGFLLFVAAGMAALVATTLDLAPDGAGRVGAAVVATAYSWGLAARSGGRPYVFGTLAAVLSAGVLVLDTAVLRSGAATLTCALAAVLAVMGTVPARRIRGAVVEALVATLVAVVGAFATVGWDPDLNLVRFEYVTLGLALAGTFVLVYRLGAGWHGLGRRGLLLVLVGAVLLAAVLAYAELVRRYGAPALVDSALQGVSWLRTSAGGAPQPLPSLLGIPALIWGTYLRARRRQGWWLCAFGVAATVRTAQSLVYPDSTFASEGISLLYSLAVGIVLGWVVVRLDQRLRGPRGAGARRQEERLAQRPEPRRWRALL